MTYDTAGSDLALPEGTALIVIDVQKGLDEPYWGVRNNPEAEQNIARLLAAWRRRSWPIYHLHHQSKNPQSPLRPNYPGNAIKDIVQPQPGEPVLQKQENSAFIGTDLEERLHAGNQTTVVLTGLVTDHCVSTTARMAANLGFHTIVVADATATFDRVSPLTGRHFSAEEIHEAELTSLSGEFARIVATEALLGTPGNDPRRDANTAGVAAHQAPVTGGKHTPWPLNTLTS
ncbi:MAG TPA: cysteine hydrolase family protein [Chloroflexia bacterium]|nr:cysteine hydrolase family protein [Chloroflexia bacterium]